MGWVLVAVPDCGYPFDRWGSGTTAGDDGNPFLTVAPALLRFRRVAVAFAPGAEERHDGFVTPRDLSRIGMSGTDAFVKRTAGLEAGGPEHAVSVHEVEPGAEGPPEHDRGSGASLWWRFEAPGPGVLRLDVVSDFQTVVAIGPAGSGSLHWRFVRSAKAATSPGP